jgi:hypothetical protein
MFMMYANAKPIPFEQKIASYSYEELKKEIGKAEFKKVGSFVTTLGGVAGTIAFGGVTIAGVSAIFSMHDQEMPGTWADVLIILTDTAILYITGAGALLTIGSIMATEASVRNIIKQQGRLNDIRLEMGKFKPVSDHETSSLGIGISIPLNNH